MKLALKIILGGLIGLILLIGTLYVLIKFDVGKKEYTAEEWKAFSILYAGKRLDEYVKLEGLNRDDFRGPYTSKDDYNPRGETYTTCYKSKTHHFCYYQGDYSDQGYKISEVSCDTPTCQWLWSQP